MSIDGKISTITGDVELSSKEDWIRVHKLRSEMDGIMVGINTIIKDNPKLRIKFFKRKTGKLHRIIVDSQLRIPLNSKVLNFELDNYPTIIITTTNAPENKVNQIKRMNSEINIIKCGSNNKVDLKIMVEKLKSLGINKILLEGGGTLNFSMLKNRLVDELRIAIAPVIIGGKNAITLVEGYGFEKISNAIKLKLIKKQMFGHNLVLYYHIQN